MSDKEAAKFMEDHSIVGVKLQKKHISKFVRNREYAQELRYGLRDAWNYGRNEGWGDWIKYSDDVVEGGRKSHDDKVRRETENKVRGDEILQKAHDQYNSEKYSGPVDIEGFRLCSYRSRKRSGTAMALSRATGRTESRAMMDSESIDRGMVHSDTYKWFSEAQAHTEKFINTSSTDTGTNLVIWLDLPSYLGIRQETEHEFLSGGRPGNRFHQENVSSHAHLINIGIHPNLDKQFNECIIKVKHLRTLSGIEKKPLIFDKRWETPGTALQAMPEELLFMNVAGFDLGDLREWRASDAFKWYEDMILTFGPQVDRQRLTALAERIKREFRR